MEQKHELVMPTRHIGQKVRRTGGPSPEVAILNALNAAEELMDGYQGWAVDDLEALWRAFRESSATGAGGDTVQRLFDMAHEIRGQGGTFGFPLISEIGDSLCKFLDGRAALGPRDFNVVKVHILAMKAVFRQQLKGDCGALAGDLSKLLQALCDHVAPDRRFDEPPH